MTLKATLLSAFRDGWDHAAARIYLAQERSRVLSFWMSNDLEIIFSPLSGRFTRDGLTVMIEIYRFNDVERWALEVIEEDDTTTIWSEEFPTDQAAYSSFIEAIAIEGLYPFLRSRKTTRH